MQADARIPVSQTTLGVEHLGAETALVLAADDVAPAGALVERLSARPSLHATACPCCTPRAALAEALNRLFQRRARGEVGFFRAIEVALPLAEIEAALADPLVASRFRLAQRRAPEAPTEGRSRFHCG
jgi:hypothetical protein